MHNAFGRTGRFYAERNEARTKSDEVGGTESQ